ncbi:anhydro-N-acetylmuramic acid kinase [Acidisoma sp. S159]|uniref:anhydro-N-acetylmuramic acid kinase n=1 Tax=Acidisoma sp. S159 TaxID=1747225 RepID=UPI00131B0505|nr:anhydro-N-acetylmuramic acid kinase [Acidisoma sp. S159]
MALVLGLNSGSSFDGVDAVVIEITDGPDGYPERPKFVDGHSYDWPGLVAEQVLRAFENKLSLFELCRLNYLAGAVYAESARTLMRKLRLGAGDLEVIGFDGQTLYQEPPDHARLKDFVDDENLVGRWLDGPYGCGLQIGEPSIVAEACETPTVTQFRPMDHALGGTGAPLMQYLDFVAFRDIGPVLTLNIGGIANCQLADRDRSRMMAFDTGPGNVMLDQAARARLSQAYDADGATAARGRIDQTMLGELLAHPYFHRPVPRSAWRLDFGSEYADAVFRKYSGLSSEDLFATLTEFTAIAITRSIADNVSRLAEIRTLIASGGGTRNGFLMKRLAAHLPSSLRLAASDEFGMPAQFKEAIKFATLAHATINRLANNIPAASGAERFGILGKLVYPPRMALGAADPAAQTTG